MDLALTVDADDVLTVHLVEREQASTVQVQPSRAGAVSLCRALDGALRDGYGECFWPAAVGGHYWWIFTTTAEAIEVVAMWSRGGATGWEHVFRATDSAGWVRERLHAELTRLGVDARE